MKKLAVALMIAGLVAGGAAVAADKPTVGVVDMGKVLTETKAGKRNQAEFQKLVESKSEQLKKEGAKFDKLRQDAQKDEAIMTDKQKEEKQKELQSKYEVVRKMQADAEQEVGKRRTELMGKTIQDARAVVGELAKEQGLAVVLSVNTPDVLFAADGVNLTAKVIERLDAKTK